MEVAFSPFAQPEIPKTPDLTSSLDQLRDQVANDEIEMRNLINRVAELYSESGLPKVEFVKKLAQNHLLNDTTADIFTFSNADLIELVNYGKDFGIWFFTMAGNSELRWEEKPSLDLAKALIDQELGASVVTNLNFFAFSSEKDIEKLLNYTLEHNPEALIYEPGPDTVYSKDYFELDVPQIDVPRIVAALADKKRYDLIVSHFYFINLIDHKEAFRHLLEEKMGDIIAINFHKFPWNDEREAQAAIQKLINSGYAPAVAINIKNCSSGLTTESYTNLAEELIQKRQGIYVAATIQERQFPVDIEKIAQLLINNDQIDLLIRFRPNFGLLSEVIEAKLQAIKKPYDDLMDYDPLAEAGKAPTVLDEKAA